MRKVLLAVLLTLIVTHAPWRLAVLGVESMFLTPGYARISTENTRYWDALDLTQSLENLGYRVEYVPKIVYNGNEALGVTMPEMRKIFIDQTQTWNARFTTLAHEGGHVLQPAGLTEGQGEVFAEAVAFLVDGGGAREHARYIARYRGDTIVMLLAYWPEMYRAASLLEDR